LLLQQQSMYHLTSWLRSVFSDLTKRMHQSSP
jgi:hypothetical protein